MMKLRKLIGVFFSVLALGAAAPKVPVIHHDVPAAHPAVAETGSLVEIADSGIRNDENTPPGMLAAKFAVNGFLYRWRPSPDSAHAAGGADLIDAALSPDESVLVIAERIGGNTECNSTRLVFVNLHNHRIIRSLMLKEKLVRSVAFIGDNSGRLLAAMAQQPMLEQPEEIVVIEPVTGKIAQLGGALAHEVVQCGSSGTAVYYTLRGEDAVFRLPLRDLAAAPQRICSRIRSPKFALSSDGGTLAVFGSGVLERYQVTPDAEPMLLESLDMARDFSPAGGAFIGKENRIMLFLNPGGKNQLHISGVMQELNDHSSGLYAWNSSAEVLICASEVNQGLILYHLPGFNAEKPVYPGKIKPLNRNENFRVFSRSGTQPELILLDHRGNLYSLLITPRRWKKQELLIVDRTGFK